jgi:transcriptional regulator with XRE-family HTH domain
MSERDAFGPNLRRLRVQRGVSLEHIAATTKVAVDLWAALERNDFSQWPAGIYARANVRAYAVEVGIDPDGTVEEFCRSFPTGDRRAERVVREHAAIVGHDLRWKDDLVGTITEEKRASASSQNVSDAPAVAFASHSRIIAATLDLLFIAASAGAGAMLLPWGWAAPLAVCALAYNAVSLVVLGCTPAVWAIDTYLLNRHPGTNRAGSPRFLRLDRSSDRAKA